MFNFKLQKEDVYNFLKDGNLFFSKLAAKFYGESIGQTGMKAFSEAIEIGIENTIATLYDACVPEEELIRVVESHWGLTKKEVKDRLVWEMGQAPIRALKRYLKEELGYTDTQVTLFMRETRASGKIRNTVELWDLFREPAKLMEAVKEMPNE